MTDSTTPTEPAEQQPWDHAWFDRYVICLKRNAEWYGENDIENSPRTVYQSWLHQLIQKFPLHPSVQVMIEKHRPVNFEQLANEWPHVSETDDTRLAYTRNAVDGERDRQLVTSIGKYLSRHWPHVPDHIRRDAQALYSIDERIIVDTTPEFVRSVESGPRSCMASAHGSIPWHTGHRAIMEQWFGGSSIEPQWSDHPYWCYDPALGWRMAQRWATIEGQRRLDGRALLYSHPELTKGETVFVRTYRRNLSDPVNGWSETDFMLQAWLERQGFKHIQSWPDGAQIRTKADDLGRYFMPYVDGQQKRLTLNADLKLLTFDSSSDFAGSYTAENTNVWVGANGGDYEDDDDDDDYFYCEDCDERTHCDDGFWVGYHEDHHVCEGCCDEIYRYVSGAGRHYPRDYYIHQDRAATVRGDDNYWIDSENPPSDVVWSNPHGEFLIKREAVEVGGEWYVAEDGGFVQCTDDGNWILSADAVISVDTECCMHRDDAFEGPDGMYYEMKENVPKEEVEDEVELEE